MLCILVIFSKMFRVYAFTGRVFRQAQQGSIMKYKNYVARIEYDEVDRIFVGHSAGIKDIVGFHGSTVDELEKAFREAVDNYLAISEETGRPALTGT